MKKFKDILTEAVSDHKDKEIVIKSYKEGSIFHSPTSHFVGYHEGADKNGLNSRFVELAKFKHHEHADAFAKMLKK